MLVHSVNNVGRRIGFNGYQHVKNNVGDTIYRFNYPYDYETENCEIQFFKLKQKPNYEYELIESPIAVVRLQEGGVDVNLQSITSLGKDEPFAYKYVRKDKNTGSIIAQGADSGMVFTTDSGKVKYRTRGKGLDEEVKGSEYTFVSQLTTTPRVQGSGYLVYPESQRVGVKYRDFADPNTGEIYLDKDEQAMLEKVHKTFSNKLGGNLAGLEANIDYLDDNGYKIQLANPIAGGDNRSGHRYWNKNNFQIADDMGTMENFNSYARKLFQKGKVYVYDGTFTSEGLEGIHFQYALRWANKSPQTFYWFKMHDLKKQPLGLGVIPNNKENVRHRVINAPVIYNESTQKIEANPRYNSNKETLFQIYDASQVSDEQLAKLDKPIENYEKIKSGNLLDINSHDDTLINYLFEVNPKEYEAQLKSFVKFNKSTDSKVDVNSPSGTEYIAQFSNFKLTRKLDGNFVAWDANTDMAKMNYQVSGYDEKVNQSITIPSLRDYETKMRVRGAFEVQDMALQAAKYWTKNLKDTQIIYSAQVLKGANSQEKIKELISKGLLPKETLLSEEAITNVLNGYYNLAPKGVLEKDSVTVKSLMSLPLDSLEFAENTVGVLSTSYFSNRAINEDTLGLSRFELMQDNNPHLVEEYSKTYLKTNLMFTNEIKNFADSVIKNVNESSSEKLLDEEGNYTEFGEYVIELMGPSIAKYALLKSLTGEGLKTKILANGEITYDYRDIKDKTTLKTLGINAANPQDEAMELARMMEKGLSKLDNSDVDYLVKSITSRIEGLNTNSFRLAEAMVQNASLGLSWRLDAAKDIMDQDAVRNGEVAFDDSWQNLIAFWKKFVQAVKSENPDSYIVAELTDIPEVMRDTLGEFTSCYDNMPDIGLKFKTTPDALTKFFNETGITSEAAYSYFFTDVQKVFACDFTDGSTIDVDNERCNKFMVNLRDLINTRGVDYVRNLYTFVGNHDKPRILHGMALDMKLFTGSLSVKNEQGEFDYARNRENRIKSMIQLANADDYASLPLEAKLNVDNPEYFRTVSTYAVAMSQLLRDAVNDSLSDVVASKDEIAYLKSALVDLTNGNFLDNGVTTKIPTIMIPELTSVDKALRTMLKSANITLTDAEFQAILERANDPALVEQFYIQGDFDGKDAFAKRNQHIIETILRGSHESSPSGEWEFMKYSVYTVAVAGLLRQAFIDVKGDDLNARSRFLNASKEFVKKYDRVTVEASRNQLPFLESSAAAMAKNGFASRDFKTAVEMMVEQAEYKARKDGKLGEGQHFSNSNQIVLNVWKNATEPAVQKSIMMMNLLSGLVGIPTIYGGDELGMSGFDEKAKNIYLQSRNPLPWSELEEGIFKDFRQKVLSAMNGAMDVRNRDGVTALNNGSAYALSTSDIDIPAFMMQDGYGNMTVSVFNTTGIKTSPRFDYYNYLGINDDNKEKFFEENNIESINKNNRYVPIQPNKDIDYIALGAGVSLPLGMIFMNSDVRDKAIYFVDRIKDKNGNYTSGRAIYKKGGKISLNGLTAKNGTMVLKYVKDAGKRLVFKGNSDLFSKQYNIAPKSCYQKPDATNQGELLSLLVK